MGCATPSWFRPQWNCAAMISSITKLQKKRREFEFEQKEAKGTKGERNWIKLYRRTQKIRRSAQEITKVQSSPEQSALRNGCLWGLHVWNGSLRPSVKMAT